MTIVQLHADAIEDVFPRWMTNQRVKCKGLTSFFYPSRSNAEVARAKAVCNGLDEFGPCAFRKQCLQYAINHGELYGVWGGTSERDRRKIRRARYLSGNARIYNFEDVRFPGRSYVRPHGVVFVKRKVS